MNEDLSINQCAGCKWENVYALYGGVIPCPYCNRKARVVKDRYEPYPPPTPYSADGTSETLDKNLTVK